MRRPDHPVVHAVVALWGAALVALGIAYRTQSWSIAALAVGAVVLVGAAVGFFRRRPLVSLFTSLVATGAGLVGAGATNWDAALASGGVVVLALAGSAAAVLTVVGVPTHGASADRVPANADVVELLRMIQENSRLSESAKRVLFRTHEIELLRGAIERDIEEGRHDAALALCTELATAFGLVGDAETYRARIQASRQTEQDAETRAALATFDALLADRNWTLAMQEAARIRRLYGQSQILPDLDAQVREARESHKRDLERRFLEAAQRDDAEHAIELLKELDRYLSSGEGERLAEVARGVVGRHRENMGVRFRMAVHEHRWRDAIEAGEAIVREFPNVKMAEEVRAMLPVLRMRGSAEEVRI